MQTDVLNDTKRKGKKQKKEKGERKNGDKAGNG